MNDLKNSTLLPFIVLFTSKDFTVPEASLFQAENSEHAEEQMEAELPGANIVWVVQTNNIDEAFTVYHQESSIEDLEETVEQSERESLGIVTPLLQGLDETGIDLTRDGNKLFLTKHTYAGDQLVVVFANVDSPKEQDNYELLAVNADKEVSKGCFNSPVSVVKTILRLLNAQSGKQENEQVFYATKRLIDSVWTLGFIKKGIDVEIVSYDRNNKLGYDNEKDLPQFEFIEGDDRIVTDVLIAEKYEPFRRDMFDATRHKVVNPKYIFSYS